MTTKIRRNGKPMMVVSDTSSDVAETPIVNVSATIPTDTATIPTDDTDTDTDTDDSEPIDTALPDDVAAKMSALPDKIKSELLRLETRVMSSANKAFGALNTPKMLEFAWDCHAYVVQAMFSGMKHEEATFHLRRVLLEAGHSDYNSRPNDMIAALHVALIVTGSETPDDIAREWKIGVNFTTLVQLKVCLKRNQTDYHVKPMFVGVIQDCLERKLVGQALKAHLKAFKAEVKRLETESAKSGASPESVAIIEKAAIAAERKKQLGKLDSAIKALRKAALAANLSRTEIRDALISEGLILPADYYGPVPTLVPETVNA